MTQEIQTKIIEIIFKFLRPEKNFLRYQKIIYSINCLKNKMQHKHKFRRNKY